jgi:Flp pilus assembly CpaF family ATPase
MRIHAAISPVSQSPIEMSIRRFTHKPTHPMQLLPSRVWDATIIAYLEAALACDCNMVIAGNTGSGKTTTLNALTHLFPIDERIVTIEETPELSLAHPHRVCLSPKSGTPFDLSRLIRETLRMRPDRVIVGEVRFPDEARAVMESVLAGQGKGTYFTFHGHSSHETLARLRQYGWSDQDLGWLDILVIQRRWSRNEAERKTPSSVRKIIEVVELDYDAQEGLRMHPIFTYNPRTEGWDAAPSIKVAERFPLYFPHTKWESFLQERISKIPGGKIHARDIHPAVQAGEENPTMGIHH